MAAALALLAGCVPTAPFRTVWNAAVTTAPPADCEAAASRNGSTAAQLPNHERTQAYDLYYVEFDEQGLLYPRSQPNVGIASCHIEALIRDLEGLVQTQPGLSIIVYVHGW